MKYYETTLHEYVQKVEKNNLHADHPQMRELLNVVRGSGSRGIETLPNLVLYGQSGIGKYSQALYLLSKCTPKDLKVQNKISIVKDNKDKYTYTMTDIHFEIDMETLGCNSKTIWHEIYLQIVDIVSINPTKTAFIVCKNFHLIHSELLEIFYSYLQNNISVNVQNTKRAPQTPMQTFGVLKDNIKIKYILLTEQVSFIPNNIINNFMVVPFARPTKSQYNAILSPENRLTDTDDIPTNIKELYKPKVEGRKVETFTAVEQRNIICQNIVEQLENPDKIIITHFRDILYDLLTYNIDIGEALWHILKHFIHNGTFTADRIPCIMEEIFEFLRKFNNNYRPITHLESIFMFFLNEIGDACADD